MTRAAALAERLDSAASLAIICHDNPDPDCLASALALNVVAADSDVEDVRILYGGEVSHQQNRAFVNLFEVDLDPVETADLDDFSLLAFVDHSIPGQNTAVPEGTDVDVVIDHHPPSEPVTAAYADVREEYGATATILVEYLRDLDIELTPTLASALLFALHRERIDYVRSPTINEYEAASYVYPAVDRGLLDQMYGAAFSSATLDALGEAIRNREIRGSALVTGVGRTTERDALPQAADYLLNLEGISTVLVFGIVDDVTHLSARSMDPRVDVGDVLVEGFADVGRLGGHQDMAGGQIPLGLFANGADDDEALVAFVSKRIANRFFDSMKLEERDETE
jgi:nanoRNase/pAp phosphatase (c-di-AMP/oligoRNAs hydrolase)